MFSHMRLAVWLAMGLKLNNGNLAVYLAFPWHFLLPRNAMSLEVSKGTQGHS